MRGVIVPVVVHLGLLAAGFGVLSLLGVLRGGTVWRWAAAGGLAYVCGMTCVLLSAIALGTVGVPFGLATVGVVAAVFALPCLLALRDRPRLRPLPRPRDAEQWYAVAVLAGFAVLVVAGLWSVGLRVVSEYDAWNLWVRKAALMFWESELPG